MNPIPRLVGPLYEVMNNVSRHLLNCEGCGRLDSTLLSDTSAVFLTVIVHISMSGIVPDPSVSVNQLLIQILVEFFKACYTVQMVNRDPGQPAPVRTVTPVSPHAPVFLLPAWSEKVIRTSGNSEHCLCIQ